MFITRIKLIDLTYEIRILKYEILHSMENTCEMNETCLGNTEILTVHCNKFKSNDREFAFPQN